MELSDDEDEQAELSDAADSGAQLLQTSHFECCFGKTTFFVFQSANGGRLAHAYCWHCDNSKYYLCFAIV